MRNVFSILSFQSLHFSGQWNETDSRLYNKQLKFSLLTYQEQINGSRNGPCGLQVDIQRINLLKTKRNLLYLRNQSIPCSKHFPPRL